MSGRSRIGLSQLVISSGYIGKLVHRTPSICGCYRRETKLFPGLSRWLPRASITCLLT